MKITALDKLFSICKIKDVSDVDFSGEYVFLSKNAEELSLVCETSKVPSDAEHDDGWKALKIDQVMDLSLVGVIARLSGTLAQNNIPVFVISTFNTDYILVKSDNLALALTSAEQAGFHTENGL